MGRVRLLALSLLSGCLVSACLALPVAADPPITPPSKPGTPPAHLKPPVQPVGPGAGKPTPPVPPASPASPAPDAGVPTSGFLPILERLRATLEHAGARPSDDGFAGLHFATWKLYQKPRTGRMRGRLDTMAQPGRWTVDAEGHAIAVAPSGWSPMVRSVAALFSEIGTIQRGYAKVKVSPDRAIRTWIRRHPRPDPIGRVPSEDALDRIQSDIRILDLRGYFAPASWTTERDRLVRLVAAEQAAARERNRLAYLALKRATIEGLTQSAGQTRLALHRDDAALDGVMDDLRGLIAILQALEQRRLEALVAQAPGDDAWREKAAALLAKVEKGRIAGLAFKDRRPSRYGGLLRQKWLLPHDNVLSAIKKAVRAAASAGK